jgi:hypothetical protein
VVASLEQTGAKAAKIEAGEPSRLDPLCQPGFAVECCELVAWSARLAYLDDCATYSKNVADVEFAFEQPLSAEILAEGRCTEFETETSRPIGQMLGRIGAKRFIQAAVIDEVGMSIARKAEWFGGPARSCSRAAGRSLLWRDADSMSLSCHLHMKVSALS